MVGAGFTFWPTVERHFCPTTFKSRKFPQIRKHCLSNFLALRPFFVVVTLDFICKSWMVTLYVSNDGLKLLGMASKQKWLLVHVINRTDLQTFILARE